jgi:hypothetical protein
MNAISAASPSADGRRSILSLGSAVPVFSLYGRSFWEPFDTEVFPSAQAEHFIHSAILAVSGTVTVASGMAFPMSEEWDLVSVEPRPARDAMLAALWDRLMRSVRKAVSQEGDQVTAVSAETIEHARRLLGELPEAVELPQVTVSSEGEIIFTWFRSDNRMEAILAPDHHLTWVFRLDGKVTDGDVIALDDGGSLGPFYKAVADFYE